ncbi:uncharacterized protein EURHEDRAFT_415991 [Aspergillus ruber CBS 135680]|uniref:Uncharacterized protein n=1 Tax=Aspergillus ruber (strain CBS 135680) TaxID=1388766 RepID=A0A017S4P5_ASPRC|nr:uncharacterized protein EURHEDRAFT_415991 [Aspergillus ruber CBS 135680]EYE91993.1 hypothetical protein EURHEDRAFT_415991 [Aspergillus ruber CBS 135680]
MAIPEEDWSLVNLYSGRLVTHGSLAWTFRLSSSPHTGTTVYIVGVRFNVDMDRYSVP